MADCQEGHWFVGVMIIWLAFCLLEAHILRSLSIKGEIRFFFFKFHLSVFPKRSASPDCAVLECQHSSDTGWSWW